MIDIQALTDRLIRRGASYRASRASGVPEVARWLRHHRDGGWLQSGDADRETTARRLLFLLWLVAEGRCSDLPTSEESDAVEQDGCVTSGMLARAYAIPSGPGRGRMDDA